MSGYDTMINIFMCLVLMTPMKGTFPTMGQIILINLTGLPLPQCAPVSAAAKQFVCVLEPIVKTTFINIRKV